MWLGTLRKCLGLLLNEDVFGEASMPQHVAFIMDGNRRFANQQCIGKLDGHSMGYSKMVEVIHWCLDMGVQYISVYAFSIDNFQRSHEEVSTLMQLAERKYKELAQEEGLPEQEGVEVRILGDLDLAPASVCGAAARLMQATAAIHNKQAVLNICFAYTSTEETLHAVDTLQSAQHARCITPGDVTPELLERCLRTKGCPPVDLLIRTSGETRLSDFLVWQASHAHLAFVDKLWPDFSFVDFLRCILDYMRHAPALQQLRRCSEPGPPQSTETSAPRPTTSPQAPSCPSTPAPLSNLGALIHLLTPPATAMQTLPAALLSFFHAVIASIWTAMQQALIDLLRSVLSILVLACAATAAGGAWALGVAQTVLVCASRGAQADRPWGQLGLSSKERKNGLGEGDRDGGTARHAQMQDAIWQLRHMQPLCLLSRSPDPIQMHALVPAEAASHAGAAASPAGVGAGAGAAASLAGAAGCLSAARHECEVAGTTGEAGGHAHQPELQCTSPEQKKLQLPEGSIVDEQLQGIQGSAERWRPFHPLQCKKQRWTRDKERLPSLRGRRQLQAEGAAGAQHLPLHVQRLLQWQQRQHEAWLEAHIPLA